MTSLAPGSDDLKVRMVGMVSSDEWQRPTLQPVFVSTFLIRTLFKAIVKVISMSRVSVHIGVVPLWLLWYSEGCCDVEFLVIISWP